MRYVCVCMHTHTHTRGYKCVVDSRLVSQTGSRPHFEMIIRVAGNMITA
jgi:hypothetical protein